MPLHPQAQAFVEELSTQNPPSWEELGVEAGREAFKGFAPMLGEAPPTLICETHQLEDGLRFRLYCESTDACPVLIYFHGGGWVLGDIDTHDAMCRRMAIDSGCAVVSVDYRCSPENEFPGPIDDCFRVTKYVVENAEMLGVDATRLGVGGDSAGGHLATSVAIRAREAGAPKIGLQVLLYPVIEPDFETDSYRAFAEGYGLTRDTMMWFWKHFLGDHAADGNAVPSRASTLAGLPPAMVEIAEYDVLRDEGTRYAQLLADAGVDVALRETPGMLHGFLHFAGLFDTGMEVGRQVAQEIGRRLRSDHPHS